MELRGGNNKTVKEEIVVSAPVVKEAEVAIGELEISGANDEEVISLLNEAKADIEANNMAAARDKLNDALRMGGVSENQKQLIKGQLSQLSDKWLFSREVFAKDSLCSMYRVMPGDTLANIGSKFKVPYEILMAVNGIARPELLRAGSTIKVVNGPFHAIVYRSDFTIDIYLQHTFVKSYRVGLGTAGRDTPTGLWRVKRGGKMISPAWTDPDTGRRYEASDPDYPLGSRWIGLEGIEGAAKGRTGFAIHGTKDPSSIGTRSSRGCIRLYNGDVMIVYNMLAEGLSEVRVYD